VNQPINSKTVKQQMHAETFAACAGKSGIIALSFWNSKSLTFLLINIYISRGEQKAKYDSSNFFISHKILAKLIVDAMAYD